MRPRRWLAAGCLAGLTGTALLLAAGTPAMAAAGADTITVSTATPSVGGNVTVTATCTSLVACHSVPNNNSPVAVSLTSPEGCVYPLGKTSPSTGTLTYTLDTATDTDGAGGAALPATTTSGCSAAEAPGGDASAGSWTATMQSPTPRTVAFTVVPPAPGGVTAAAAAGGPPTTATLRWTAVAIPDVSGYTVRDVDAGSTASPQVYTPAEAGCSTATTCSVSLAYPDAAAGSSHTLTVQTDTDASPTETSAASHPVTFTVASPTPSASTSPSTGAGGNKKGSSGSGGKASTGGSGAVSTGSGTGNSATSAQSAAQRQVASTFSRFGPSTGIPGLPPLPQVSSPAAGDNPALGDSEPTNPGTYSPTLGYPSRATTARVKHPSGVAAVYDNLTSAVTPTQLWRSVAAALLLVLVAAHVRAWLGGAPARGVLSVPPPRMSAGGPGQLTERS